MIEQVLTELTAAIRDLTEELAAARQAKPLAPVHEEEVSAPATAEAEKPKRTRKAKESASEPTSDPTTDPVPEPVPDPTTEPTQGVTSDDDDDDSSTTEAADEAPPNEIPGVTFDSLRRAIMKLAAQSLDMKTTVRALIVRDGRTTIFDVPESEYQALAAKVFELDPAVGEECFKG
jgi:hypothetical protein